MRMQIGSTQEVAVPNEEKKRLGRSWRKERSMAWLDLLDVWLASSRGWLLTVL